MRNKKEHENNNVEDEEDFLNKSVSNNLSDTNLNNEVLKFDIKEAPNAITENLKNGIFENNMYTYISNTPEADEEYLIFIVHGIGQNEQKLENTLNKITPIIKSLYQNKKNILFKQIHIRIINWKTKIANKFKDPLSKISLLTDRTRIMKSIIHQSAADILFYTHSHYKYEILNDIIDQMNDYYKLVCKYRKLFYGNVSLIGHSIGSVMCYDILRHMKYERNEKKEENIDKEDVKQQRYEVKEKEHKAEDKEIFNIII